MDNNGGSEDHNHHQLFVPSLDGHHADSGRLPSLLSNNNSTSHFDENLVKNHSDGASRDSQHLPTDTIVLVGSLIVMIFIGKPFFILNFASFYQFEIGALYKIGCIVLTRYLAKISRDGHSLASRKSLNTTDTIVLVGSLIVMILIYQFEFGAL